MTEYQMVVDAFKDAGETHADFNEWFDLRDVAKYMRCSVPEAAKIASYTGDDCIPVYEAAGFVYEDGWFKPREGGEG